MVNGSILVNKKLAALDERLLKTTTRKPVGFTQSLALYLGIC